MYLVVRNHIEMRTLVDDYHKRRKPTQEIKYPEIKKSQSK